MKFSKNLISYLSKYRISGHDLTIKVSRCTILLFSQHHYPIDLNKRELSIKISTILFSPLEVRIVSQRDQHHSSCDNWKGSDHNQPLVNNDEGHCAWVVSTLWNLLSLECFIIFNRILR